MPERRCSKGVVRTIHKPLLHATKPYTKEWIMNFETKHEWRTSVVAPNLEVILQMIQLYSLHHMDINLVHSAHTTHHCVYEPTCQSQRETTLLIHPSALSCQRTWNTIFIKMRQNAHFETTTTCKTSKIVVEGKEKYVL